MALKTIYLFGYLRGTLVATKVLGGFFVSSERKTSGNYDLDQVVVSSGFSENEKKREGVIICPNTSSTYHKGLGGVLSLAG